MKKWTLTVVLMLFVVQLFAQGENVIVAKQRVFDGDGLNMKFDYDEVFNHFSNIMITGKDATGKVVWKPTQVVSTKEVKFDEQPGQSIIIKGEGGQGYEVLSNITMKRIRVNKLDKAGKATSVWLLYERGVKLSKNSNGKVQLKYGSGMDMQFVLDQLTHKISEIKVNYKTPTPGYQTLKVISNDNLFGEMMTCTAEIKNATVHHQYEINYDPNAMDQIDVIITSVKSNTTKEYSLKLKKD